MTIEKSWGWVFLYQSKKWVETRNEEYLFLGNAPFFVTKQGELHIAGTSSELENYIAQFEKCGSFINCDK